MSLTTPTNGPTEKMPLPYTNHRQERVEKKGNADDPNKISRRYALPKEKVVWWGEHTIELFGEVVSWVVGEHVGEWLR